MATNKYAIRQINTYTDATAKAAETKNDPDRSIEYREQIHNKIMTEARAFATTEHTEMLGRLEQAKQVYAAEENQVNNLLTADPARVGLSWQAMQPLLTAGQSYIEVAKAADNPSDLGALLVFVPPLVRAGRLEHTGFEHDTLDADTKAIEKDALANLQRAVLDTAPKVGIDTARLVEARESLEEARALTKVWLDLSQMDRITVEATLAGAQTDPELWEAIKVLPRFGSDLEHAIAAQMALQERGTQNA